MMQLLGLILAFTVASQILPGVQVDSWQSLVVAAVALAVVNSVVRPLLVLLTLPVTILTLGAFYLVLNGVLVLLVDWLVPGFSVDGLGWAILFSLVLSLISSVLGHLAQPRPQV